MAGKWLVPIDLAQYELQNAVIQNLAAPPSSPREGQTYYDTVLQQERFWNGAAWVNKGAATGGATSVSAADSTLTITPTTGAVTAKVAAGVMDHTYITDFDTQVRTSRLDQMAAPTADVSLDTHKITSVTDPSNPQDASTKAYTDAGDTAVTAAVEAWVALNYGQPPSDLQTGTQWELAQYAQSVFGIPIRLEAGATMTLAAGSMLVGK